MSDKLKRVTDAIASGCYDELVAKEELTREQYIERYARLFEGAARKAMAEMGSV